MIETQRTIERLIRDLKSVARDGEDLLRSIPADLTGRTSEIRNRFEEALNSARDTCRGLEGKAVEQAQELDKAIHERPYQTMGIAFGIGLLVGVLLNRRD